MSEVMASSMSDFAEEGVGPVRRRSSRDFVTVFGAIDSLTNGRDASPGQNRGAPDLNPPPLLFPEELKSADDTSLIRGIIESVPAFAALTPSLREHAIGAMQLQHVNKFANLLVDGNELNAFYVVSSGTFHQTSDHVDEEREVVVNMMERGAFFGEGALHRDQKGNRIIVRGYHIACAEQGTLYVLTAEIFEKLKSHVIWEHETGATTGVLGAMSAHAPSTVHAQTLRDASEAIGEQIAVTGFSALVESAHERPNAKFVIKAGKLQLILRRAEDRLASKNVFFERGHVISSETIISWYDARLVVKVIMPHISLVEVSATRVSPQYCAGFWGELDRQYHRKVLSTVDCFVGFTSDELDRFISNGEVMKFGKGSVIFEEGSVSEHKCLFIVLQGTARAFRFDANAEDGSFTKLEAQHVTAKRSGSVDNSFNDSYSKGHGAFITLGFFDVADHFGASTILDVAEKKRSVSVAAKTDLTVLAITREGFGPLLDRVEIGLRRQLEHRQWLITRGRIELRDIERGSLIGKGSFGRVHMGVHTSGKSFAVKMVSKAKLASSIELIDQTNSERSLLATCSHPFLLRFVSAFQSETSLYFVTEIVLGGELYQQVSSQGKLPLASAIFYTANVLAAFRHLKLFNVVYRDLKPENVLIEADGYLKVIDFGFARHIEGGRTFTFCGTPDYMAPEIVKFRGQGLEVDMWSLGVFVYELLVGSPPFETEDIKETFITILRYERGDASISYPWFFSSSAKSLIGELLNPAPESRATPSEACDHDFFGGINWTALEAKQIAAPFVPTIKDQYDISNFDDLGDDEENDQAETMHSRSFMNNLKERANFPGFAETKDWDDDEVHEFD